jgi:serine/threonine-protein kinase
VKEYSVGREVFDRRADYDPRVDPIVRVEARRLRSKLRAYYAAAGREDALLIELPKGAYVPSFRPRAARRTQAARKSHCSAIAVLPFTNLAPETSEEYFAEGLAEELNLLLTRVEGLRVIAWHSAAQLREDDPKVIGERLKVDYVLKGSVRRTPDSVRVTVQLVDTKTGEMAWSDAFSRLIHKAAVEEEMARAIVDALRISLGIPMQPPAPRTIRNVEAYNLCLQGRFHANRRTPAGLRESAACYARAIELDPESALAYAGFADSQSLFADYGLARPSEVIPKAEAAALRALELDPQSADATASLAFIRSIYDWNWDAAEQLYRRAIALNPSNAKARHWYSTDMLTMRGRFEEALEESQVARMLDPLSLIIHEGYAYVNIFMREYDVAEESLRQMLELEPRFAKSHGTLGRVYSLQGRYTEAFEEFEKARALAGPTPQLIAAIGQTQAASGNEAGARETLAELHRMAARNYVPSTSLAIVHMGLRETGPALDFFEKSAAEHEIQVAGFALHPLYEPMRKEPRFQQILRKAGF